ncbi:nitrilase-related carbon-nitrogen hydrolase [Saccharothrix luteola]|uniref:nitrilase-related carbon-nitrogen hydrolase n=1 Tax=Saccharothrix luteola TaxID=2893018 RepID=UPI001E4B8A83|nr:nitrilase-related carbon-nitrogen hydrolase [Saccharothrix luteola]MCC8247749.1 acyltransferase [Saccharothrix luteola]
MDSRSELALVGLAGSASAALFYFGTGLAPIAALAWLAPLPVLLAAPRTSGRVAAALAFGSCLLGLTNSWPFLAHSYDLPLLPWGVAVTVGMAATFALAVALFRALLNSGRALLAVITAPAAWVAVLYLVASANPTGIMGSLATTQADVPLVLQTAAITGAWGVEYLVLFAPAAVAAAVTRRDVRVAAVGGVVLAAVSIGGAVRLAQDGGPARRVALVAGNHHGWATDLDTPAGPELVAAYARQVEALPDGVRVAVLPEAAFGAREARPAVLVDTMTALARAEGIDIVVGLAQWTDGKKYNYAVTFPASGGEPVKYLKHHDTVSPTGRDLTLLGSTGVAICADVNHPDPSSDYATAGARLLAIPASDEDDNGWQHSRTALLRGVESGVAVAWSGRQTRLMASDARGRVVAEAGTGGAGAFTVVVADVPTGDGPTPYARLGDWFAWLCVGLAVAGLVGTRVRPTRITPTPVGAA